MTNKFTFRALDWLDNNHNHNKPFFLYLSYSSPYVPHGVSAKFRGKSRRGLYGDAVEELDNNVGKIMDRIKSLGLKYNTKFSFYPTTARV